MRQLGLLVAGISLSVTTAEVDFDTCTSSWQTLAEKKRLERYPDRFEKIWTEYSEDYTG